MHGSKSRKRSSIGYAFQLQEKQKVRHSYGLLEKQFRNYVTKASAKQGDTGVLLKQMLEMRLDNIVYRLGFAQTRANARQMVNHGHIKVNNKKVDIPSFQVKSGDVVSVKEGRSETKLFDGVRKGLPTHDTPGWMRLDPANWSGGILSAPTTEELNTLFDAKPIIEFYSR